MAVQIKLVPPLPVIPDVVEEPKAKTLCIWTKDKSIDVFSTLSPIIQAQQVRFAAIKCSVSNDLSVFPKADVVFAMGGAALKQLQEASVGIAKNKTVNSLRALPHRIGKTDVFFSYSAGIREVDYGWHVDLLCDFSNALMYAATGKIKPPMGKYQWVSDFTQLIADVEEKFALSGKPVDVCFDTETEGNDYISSAGRFVTLQFSAAPGTGCALFIASHEQAAAIQQSEHPVYQQLKWLLTTPKISLKAANGKYDMVWVRQKFGIRCTNFKMDTTLVGSMLDENRSNSLDVHAKLHSTIPGYSDEFDHKIDKSHMGLLAQDQELLDYACGDTDAGLQAAVNMRTELLKDSRATKFYVNCLHPGARAFEIIERGGIFVDMPVYEALEAELRAELAKLVKEVIGVVGGRIYAKHLDETKTGGLNITKPSLIRDFMFSPMGLNLRPRMLTEKTSDPVTSDEHLQMFKDVPEAQAFIRLREAYSSANKVLGYCTGFREHLRQDGRWHPWYFLFKGKFDNFDNDMSGGTVTGRLSAKDPPIQVVPKHSEWGKKMRRIFAAPPGYVLCERDYNQGELRVVACIAHVSRMLDAYAKNMDLHALTGSFIKGMTYEAVMALKKTDKKLFGEIRQPAKPANFGLLYGQGEEGFQAYAEANYNVVMPIEEAGRIRDLFFKMYFELLGYHEEAKRFGHKYGYVRSPLGRVRHLPLINSRDRQIRGKWERKAINSPVQGTLSDMLVWSLGLEYAMDYLEEAPCFATIHDACYDYLPEDNAEDWAEKKRAVMENLPFENVGWKPQIKFLADVKLGPNMSDLVELERKAA